MISRAALRQRHGLLSSTFYLSKASTTSPPSRRISPSQPSPFSHRTQARSATTLSHTVPSLGRDNEAILKDGIDGLFSPDAIREMWSIYMKHLLRRLNDILADSPYKGLDLKKLSIETARNPATAHVFNHASMAHNHHFFLSTISTKADVPMPDELRTNLSRSFSSIHTLRSTFIDVANAMFGPGYVWLVLHFNPTAHHPNTDAVPDSRIRTMATGGPFNPQSNKPAYDFRILPTYLAGSPYPGAHARQQTRDNTTVNLSEIQRQQAEASERRSRVQNSVGNFGTSSTKNIHPDGDVESISRWSGAHIVPLMCVSTWQHAYMMDFGVDGKEPFLNAWWDRINWERVWENAGLGVRERREQNYHRTQR